MKIFRGLFFLSMMFFSTMAYPQSTTKIKKVLLVVAMQQEAQPIIAKLKLHSVKMTHADLPMRAYQGRYGKLVIYLILNGQDAVNHVANIGSQAAALTTYLGIEEFHPDLIISVGTAAGRKIKHTQVGDIFISKKIYFYGRRIKGSEFHHYGIGDYSSFVVTPPASLQVGVVCTGDATDQASEDYRAYAKLNCDAIEMEAASVAWVSSLKKIPMFAVKGITNNVEAKNAEAEFANNLPAVAKKLANSVVLILQTIAH